MKVHGMVAVVIAACTAALSQPTSAIEFYDSTGTDASARLGWRGPSGTGTFFVQSPVGVDAVTVTGGGMAVSGDLQAATLAGDGSRLTNIPRPAGLDSLLRTKSDTGHTHSPLGLSPNSITSAEIADSAVSDRKIRSVSASKLTGTIPTNALDPSLGDLADGSLSGTRVHPDFGSQEIRSRGALALLEAGTTSNGYMLWAQNDIANSLRRFQLAYVRNNAWSGALLDAVVRDDDTTMHVYGNMSIHRGVLTASVSSPSDARLKTNIAPIREAVQKVSRLRGVTFDWVGGMAARPGFQARHDMGFVAQEVEQVLPELVRTEIDGYKSLAYQQITAVLVEAVKEQQAMIDALRAEVAELRNSRYH